MQINPLPALLPRFAITIGSYTLDTTHGFYLAHVSGLPGAFGIHITRSGRALRERWTMRTPSGTTRAFLGLEVVTNGKASGCSGR